MTREGAATSGSTGLIARSAAGLASRKKLSVYLSAVMILAAIASPPAFGATASSTFVLDGGTPSAQHQSTLDCGSIGGVWSNATVSCTINGNGSLPAAVPPSQVVTLTIAKGANLTLNYGSAFNLGTYGVITNSQDMRIKGTLEGGTVYDQAGGTITNTGAIEDSDLLVEAGSVLSNGPSVILNGGIILSGGITSATDENVYGGGNLYDYGSVYNTGSIANNAGGSIIVNSNASLTQTGSGTISNDDTIDNFGGLISSNGTILSMNAINNFKGTIDSGGHFYISSSDENYSTLNNYGTVNIIGGSTAGTGQGGIINNDGILNNFGSFFGGISSNSGTFNDYSSAALFATANPGTINIYPGGTIDSISLISNTGAINNAGTIDMNASTASESFGSVGAIENQGSITEYCGGVFMNPQVVSGNAVISPNPCTSITTVAAPEFPIGLLGLVAFATFAVGAALFGAQFEGRTHLNKWNGQASALIQQK